MSPSEKAGAFAALASEMSARCAEAVDENHLYDAPNESIGQLIGALVRLYAAKVQDGEHIPPFARNSGVTTTDAAIACTALLQGVNLEVFELGAWQSMSGLGRLDLRPRS